MQSYLLSSHSVISKDCKQGQSSITLLGKKLKTQDLVAQAEIYDR